MENYNELARQLKECISTGQYNDVQALLGHVTNEKTIKLIEDKFLRLFDPAMDPVNFAINCRKEKVAIYLVEKAFPLHHVHWEDKGTAMCDEWCSKDHGPDDCPRQYNASMNALRHNMESLKLRIDAIRHLKRSPGEGLSEPHIEKFLPQPAPPLQQKPKINKSDWISSKDKKEKTAAAEAREIVLKNGIRYSSKKGGTLLHMYVDRPRVFVYVFANYGVPVNVQDINGDTALHLAVRKKRLDVVEALVQCSADLSLRNSMGQMPQDEAEGPIKSFLNRFHPGVVFAVRNAKHSKLDKLYKRSWSNVHTKIKDGKSLLEWVQEKAEATVMPENITRAQQREFEIKLKAAKYSERLLSSYRSTSEMIHSVLCEDVELARRILWEHKDLKVNVRFRDGRGKTLLSHAVEVNNFDLVQLLLEYGAMVAQVRVRESEQTDVTVPLYQKALRRDIDINIVKLLQTVLPDGREHEEKDSNGNTPLLRAIQEGLDTRAIQWLLKVRGSYSLCDRNKDSLTARDLASKLGREDIVKAIDRYIVKDIPAITLRLFPVAFYSPDFLSTVDEQTGMTLEQKLNREAEGRNMKCWIDVNQMQNQAISLFTAAAKGDVQKVEQLCDANYQDRNGYTALTRAIVFNQLEVARLLCTKLRPALKKMGDNSNLYPLHYAYALPEAQGREFINLLLDRDAAEIENRVDKDGREAAVLQDVRMEKDTLQMLYDARTLDPFGKRGPPLGPWPQGADTFPPSQEDGFQQ